jgi:hypothetical protein
MQLYAEQLQAFGFSVDQLRRMMVANPLGLLDAGLAQQDSRGSDGAYPG